MARQQDTCWSCAAAWEDRPASPRARRVIPSGERRVIPGGEAPRTRGGERPAAPVTIGEAIAAVP